MILIPFLTKTSLTPGIENGLMLMNHSGQGKGYQLILRRYFQKKIQKGILFIFL